MTCSDTRRRKSLSSFLSTPRWIIIREQYHARPFIPFMKPGRITIDRERRLHSVEQTPNVTQHVHEGEDSDDHMQPPELGRSGCIMHGGGRNSTG